MMKSRRARTRTGNLLGAFFFVAGGYPGVESFWIIFRGSSSWPFPGSLGPLRLYIPFAAWLSISRVDAIGGRLSVTEGSRSRTEGSYLAIFNLPRMMSPESVAPCVPSSWMSHLLGELNGLHGFDDATSRWRRRARG